MKNTVKQVLQIIVDKFKSGEIPEVVAYASFPLPDIPSCYWSFINRTLMFLGGTGDARGYKQWQQVNRWVKKGAKAIHILIPCYYKEIDRETGDEQLVLRNFKPMPVFRVEDTDGKSLEYELPELPNFPLIEKAKEWDLVVKAVPGNYKYHGYYSSQRKEIGLATSEEIVFFHELAHASHDRVCEGLEPGQQPFQEIVAELSAQALCRLVGKTIIETTGNSFQYIESYAQKVNLTPYTACLRILADTEKVLNLILQSNTSGERGTDNE